MSDGFSVGVVSRLSKIRAMSPRELVERIQYKVAVAAERRRYRSGVLAPADRLRRAVRDDLQRGNWQRAVLDARRTTRARFFPGTAHRDRMRALFDTDFRLEREHTVQAAALATQHRFEFFGHQFQYGPEIDWHADPVTKSRWPEVFHADVPIHGGDTGFGDVKHVWELSRQQYLIDLGKAYFVTGARENVDEIERLVRGWIRGNPYACGVNWSCALEPAFRAWSWLWAYHLTVDALPPEFHLEWLRGFYDHGRFLAQHLEHYTSPYNHLIGEAAALYALGLSFPELRDAPSWTKLGRSVLEGRLGEQFYRDGGSVEQSTFYHHATVGFYLLAGQLARVNDDSLAPAVWSAIESGLTFSMSLMQPDGRIPEIGGADDGKPIRMEHLPFWDFRPYQAIGAVLFDRGDFKSAAGRFYEDALWMLGPEGYERFAALPSSAPTPTEAAFRESGYVVSRSDWSEKADYVCFDVGEQAAGMRPDAVPNSMHGHADCLSIVVWLGGRRVLVDSGLYAYNCGGEWESHFRETAAHNTAKIDGRDQARHIGKMAWSHSYRATLEKRMADGNQSWSIGSHDGYARGPHGITHRRVVWRRPAGYVLVYDQFVGAGSHDLEVNYQFAPGELIPAGEGVALFDNFAEVAWCGTGSWTSELRCGGERPEDGWICSSLGVRHPAPRVTLQGTLGGGAAALLTVIADRARAGLTAASELRALRIRLDDGAGTIMAIRSGDTLEWVAAAGLTSGGPIDTDALVAIVSTTESGRTEQAQAGGSYVHADAAALVHIDARHQPTRTL